MCVDMLWNFNVITSHIWIVIKGLYSCNSYWDIDDDDYTRGTPYDLKKDMIDNESLKYISIKGLNLAPSELENGRWWLPKQEHSPYSSIWDVYFPEEE